MKQIIILTLYLFLNVCSFCQKESSEITPDVLKKIKAEVDKEAIKFRQSLIKKDITDEAVEYSVDTFKLQHIANRRNDIDYTILGTKITVSEMTNGYDVLMNKYYRKLMRILDSADKKFLIDAQKNWLKFTKSEMEFVLVILQDKYSGGGAFTSGMSLDDYSDLVIKRTDQLFNYYNTHIALSK